eukprot:CAMPEP_0119107114 /NCGR_PEP_ID=MMETSP1180-20130426/7958_1 /TAXON_ID=3052 ORGANISM="Chlamydomonas cf sp, Strain CCMP681" /NCGR_SAMPLE_ID=MMETSP1180 /ASSEMBLY_ACC=CAM_ASM_000741 /LENGTH=178 /DNA_ID=CAMNT_0007092553 /DNA_START=15 /DNA_END=551 /DNA_ORIENTATION=+
MAGHGAKKRLEENSKRLGQLRMLLLLGIVAQAAGLSFNAWKTGSVSWGSVAALLATTAVGWACYLTIGAYAKPSHDDQGGLIDGGGDMGKGTVNGHCHDVLYITVFVQVLSPLSRWFWYFYLLVPGFALYKLCKHIIIPYIKSSWAGGQATGEPQMDAATRKKLQRTEDRAERRKRKW